MLIVPFKQTGVGMGYLGMVSIFWPEIIFKKYFKFVAIFKKQSEWGIDLVSVHLANPIKPFI